MIHAYSAIKIETIVMNNFNQNTLNLHQSNSIKTAKSSAGLVQLQSCDLSIIDSFKAIEKNGNCDYGLLISI